MRYCCGFVMSVLLFFLLLLAFPLQLSEIILMDSTRKSRSFEEVAFMSEPLPIVEELLLPTAEFVELPELLLVVLVAD